jgi:excisionase family DNA binding protein
MMDMAQACRVSVATVRRWIDRGELAAITISGGHIRITEEEMYAFVGLPIPETEFAPVNTGGAGRSEGDGGGWPPLPLV